MDRKYSGLKFITTKYSDDVIADIVFEKKDIVNTIGEVIGDAGGKQLRIAETESIRVTYFMSGGRHSGEGERRVLVIAESGDA